MNEIKNADLEQSAAAMPGAGDDRTASSGTRKARDRERKRQQARNGQKAWDADVRTRHATILSRSRC
jgi:hypothetical protein